MTTNQNRLVLGAAALGLALACTLACGKSSGARTAEAATPARVTTMNAPAKESKVTLAITGMT